MSPELSPPTPRDRVTLARTLRAPVDKVWRLWTTKAGLEAWWGPEGFVSVVNHLDVRVGGRFEIAMTAVQPDIVRYLESAGIPVTSYDRGDYAEVVLQARLAWTGAVDFVPGVAKYLSHGSVDLTPDGVGTRVVVTVDAMHDAHWTRMKTMGWEQQLAKLEQHLAADDQA